MAASRTRPGNPDRGWNDPPMFNFAPGQKSGQPRRALNKRVAFPMAGTSGAAPGIAVLNPVQGPPILNPVLPADIQGPPPVAQLPPVPIGLRDTPLGNQAPPTSPVQILPPTADSSTPQTVPVLVPVLVPIAKPQSDIVVPEIDSTITQLGNEHLEDLMARLTLNSDEELLSVTLKKLDSVLDGFKHILTQKVIEDIKKKMDILQERWQKGDLSDVVKVRTAQLAIALVDSETEKANHLHLALVVDHIAEVNQWIMGVKRLLHQQQMANKEREIIEENRLSADTSSEQVSNLGEATVGDSVESGEREGTLDESDKVTPSEENDNSGANNSGELSEISQHADENKEEDSITNNVIEKVEEDDT